MSKSYYSTTLEQSADQVWSILRDFGNYTVWVEGVDESYIEDNKAGDAVGAIRYVRMGETKIRQKLLAHSDEDRSYVYASCGQPRFPVHDFRATIRVTPIVDGDRAFVEWWATFDCAADQRDHWTGFFARSFAGWLGSLRRHVEQRA
jgi:hypothetical protein